MSFTSPTVKSDPEILGGTPCFSGTRVPVRILFEYIDGGDSIVTFLDQFPSVQREQAIQLLNDSQRPAPA